MKPKQTMKRKGYSPYEQKTLSKEQKNENLKTITKITSDPTLDDLTMRYYACRKHGSFFWRNIKTNQGLCFMCKQEGLTKLTKRHIKDSELSEKILAIVEQKMNERNEGGEYMKVEESVKIDDGKYNGKIVAIEERTEPFEYTDFIIEFQVGDRKAKLPFGCPSKILVDKETNEPTSKLAMALKEFGYEMEIGKDISVEDLTKHFVGENVSSLIQNKKSKTSGQIFATVVSMTPKK